MGQEQDELDQLYVQCHVKKSLISSTLAAFWKQ